MPELATVSDGQPAAVSDGQPAPVSTGRAAVPERPGQRLTYLIKRVEMAERARMEEVLRPLGVTLHQYTVLSILDGREGLSSAQLARRHFVTPQAMHQMVGGMERDGLIERRPDEANRKILRAWLTERGSHVLRSCHHAIDELEERMLAALAPAEVAAFRRHLERALAALTDGSRA